MSDEKLEAEANKLLEDAMEQVGFLKGDTKLVAPYVGLCMMKSIKNLMDAGEETAAQLFLVSVFQILERSICQPAMKCLHCGMDQPFTAGVAAFFTIREYFLQRGNFEKSIRHYENSFKEAGIDMETLHTEAEKISGGLAKVVGHITRAHM